MPCEDYEEESTPLAPRTDVSVVRRLLTHLRGIVQFVYGSIYRLVPAAPLHGALHLAHRYRRRG